MSGSTFGRQFCITTWGESHGAAIGAVIDGCPAGLTLDASDIQHFLDRRKPGQNQFTTKRQESDQVQILSGVFEGKTTGTPISLIVQNQDQRSRDYGNIASVYRPGHADYTYTQKYGFRDYRGGGRSSGRETIGRVAGGAVASKILSCMGIQVTAYTRSIGDIVVPDDAICYNCINENPLYMPNNEYASSAASYLEECMKSQDSAGGIVECIVTGMPAGIGETVFEKLDANLAKAVMSIGAVKGVEIGDGFSAASSKGSLNNDSFISDGTSVSKETNHAGGILGGMSDASPIIIRAAFKPTPSISQVQKTVDMSGENIELSIHGRHDPVIVPRAVVVVEAMTAITIVDMLFANMAARLDRIIDFYCK